MPQSKPQAVAALEAGFWVGGANSGVDAGFLPDTFYQWSTNTMNRGGYIQTRPGYAEQIIPSPFMGSASARQKDKGAPQGGTIFVPKNGIPQMLLALQGRIYVADWPFTAWRFLNPRMFWDSTLPINFATAIKSVDESSNGTLLFIEPYPIVIIHQSRRLRAAMWDGVIGRFLDPTAINVAHETPPGSFSIWNNNRLWVADGRRLRASNLGDPIKFTEEDILKEGGYFTLPDTITAIGETADERTLLAFTNNTTSAFKSSVLVRSTWFDTPDFQHEILPGIGCVSHRSVINQWGLTWFYSQGGLTSLDTALQTYRTSRVRFRDGAMKRSKSNMSPDRSGICCGKSENLLFVSVPSGDIHNAHTHVLDQGVIESLDEGSAPAWASVWNGIRPVQWFNMVRDGEERVYALSRDYAPPAVKPWFYTIGLWEVLQGRKADVYRTIPLAAAPKRIKCDWETKMFSNGSMLFQLLFIEFDIVEMSGRVDGSVSFAGKRSGYQKMFDFSLEATKELVLRGPNVFQVPLNQQRVLRSPALGRQTPHDATNCVQSHHNLALDRGFSFLVKWEGEMAIRGMRLFIKPEPELQVGECMEIETTRRYVYMSGKEVKTAQPRVLENWRTEDLKARFMTHTSAKYTELSYAARY